MAQIPLVDLKAQYLSIRGEVYLAIQRVLEQAQFISGPSVAEFESAFAEFCGARHAVGVGSGTAALHLALRASGIGPGDEVITSPLTFFATVEAISHVGARPVFVDIDPRTYTLDPARIATAINVRTRALLPVHLYGQPAAMEPILALARERGLKVIVDAAQAHGATYLGRPMGNWGDLACFSFYPGKNLGGYGDAGAVVTDDPALAATVAMLRDHGRTDKYEHRIVGYGERLDTLQAAILLVKLRHLGAWVARRQALAASYDRLLAGLPGLVTPTVENDRTHAFHLYVVRHETRDALRDALAREGIASGIHYPVPLHLQPACAGLGYRSGDFPIAETAASQVVSLPMYPELTPDQVRRIANTVQRFCGSR